MTLNTTLSIQFDAEPIDVYMVDNQILWESTLHSHRFDVNEDISTIIVFE